MKVLSRKEPSKLPGGVVVEGFPGSGLAGTIAASCLVASLSLALVGEVSSDHFPPLATVLDGNLQSPARVYADPGRNIAIFLGDFDPGRKASHVLARAIVDWAAKAECAFVITSYSAPMERGIDEHTLTAVVDGPKSEEIARNASIPLARLAAVGGVAGPLLLEGRDRGMPVVALLIKTHKDTQDFESGLKIAQAIMRMVPSANCDLEAIRGEAERTEANLRRIRNQIAPPDVYK